MSKEIKILQVIILSLIVTSCAPSVRGRLRELERETKSETKLNEEIFNQIITFIETEDAEGIKSLMAPTALEQIEDIDGEIKKLFDFYEGSMTYSDSSGGSTGEEVRDGLKRTLISDTWDVETDVKTYSLSFIWYRNDYLVPGNKGVQVITLCEADTEISLYPVNSNLDKMDAGIYVEEILDLTSEDGQRSKKIAEEVIKLIEAKDVEGLKATLSEEVFDFYGEYEKIIDVDADKEYTFDGRLERLVNYYEGDMVSLKHNVRGEDNLTEDPKKIIRVRDYWEVQTTKGLYLLYIAECREYPDNPKNKGIYQIGLVDKNPTGWSSGKMWSNYPGNEHYDQPGIFPKYR